MTEALPSRIAIIAAKLPIQVYRYTFKPLVGQNCRHWPTCSDYALQAIDTNGAWRGLWLTISRLKRCGPGGTSGVDTVPDIRGEHHPFAPWRYGRWTDPYQGDELTGPR
jgi:putative membrane protein insertion efficiency factor